MPFSLFWSYASYYANSKLFTLSCLPSNSILFYLALHFRHCVSLLSASILLLNIPYSLHSVLSGQGNDYCSKLVDQEFLWDVCIFSGICVSCVNSSMLVEWLICGCSRQFSWIIELLKTEELNECQLYSGPYISPWHWSELTAFAC